MSNFSFITAANGRLLITTDSPSQFIPSEQLVLQSEIKNIYKSSVLGLIVIDFQNNAQGDIVLNPAIDNITIGTTTYNAGSQTRDALFNIIKASTVFQKANSGSGGSGGVEIGGTYNTNAAAVAALGTGKLYKSSTLVNGSPIILITV